MSEENVEAQEPVSPAPPDTAVTPDSDKEIEAKRSSRFLFRKVWFLVGIILCVIFAFVAQAYNRYRAEEDKITCLNRHKQLGIAMHNYSDCYRGYLPPAYSMDEQGNRLLPWRVLALPLIVCPHCWGMEDLDYNASWQSPANSKYKFHHSGLFTCPATAKKGVTNDDVREGDAVRLGDGWIRVREKNQHWCLYRVVVGEGTAFPGNKPLKFEDIKDGLANTIFAVECKRPICWMDPNHEMPLETALLGVNKVDDGISSYHQGGAYVLMGDGSVRFLPDSTTPEELRHLLLIADGK